MWAFAQNMLACDASACNANASIHIASHAKAYRMCHTLMGNLCVSGTVRYTYTYRVLYIASVQCNGRHWPRNADFAPESPAKLLHSPILVAVGLSVRCKDKITVLSPHRGSELSYADFYKYPPWSLGLYSPYIHLDIHLNSLGVYSHATWCHGLQIRPHRYPFAPGAMQRELPCPGAQRADTPTGYTHVLNSELDLDPESCAPPWSWSWWILCKSPEGATRRGREHA